MPTRARSPLEWPTSRETVADDGLKLEYYQHISRMMRKFISLGFDLSLTDSKGMMIVDLCYGMPTVLRFLNECMKESSSENERESGDRRKPRPKETGRKISWPEKMASKLKLLKK